MTQTHFTLITFVLTICLTASVFSSISATAEFNLPIYKRKTSPSLLKKRGSQTGAIGLGDFFDERYNVLVGIHNGSFPVILDTGSSELWVASDTCTTCSSSSPKYPPTTFQPVDGLDVEFLYGDSLIHTSASGLVGKDTITVAGLKLDNQLFAVINRTNLNLLDPGSAGLFGLGFPVNSVLWAEVAVTENHSNNTQRRHSKLTSSLRRPNFPSLPSIFHLPSQTERQTAATDSNAAIASSYLTDAPFVPRLVALGSLALPMFSISLQRDTVDIGGEGSNVGLLSIGALPANVKNDSVTWVPVRGYTVDQGGLSPPPDSPNEVYPIAWEVFIDDVFLDGQKLTPSSLSPSNITLSALFDTGDPILHGPADLVSLISQSLTGSTSSAATFPCSTPHNLTFSIGGTMFPVDPRDFITQDTNSSDPQRCVMNLAETGPPQERALYSWVLGDPFLKGVISSYYYGNLTYPSHDAPRMGFLSTVPSDAAQQLVNAIQQAEKDRGKFPKTTEAAPTGVPTAPLLADEPSESKK